LFEERDKQSLKMKIYNTKRGIIIHHEENFFLSRKSNWNVFINRSKLFQKITREIKNLREDNSLSEFINNDLLAPIGSQEIWAAGVTYLRSREARMEESKEAGGGDFYAKVYEAERPELFFKAPAYRAVGSGEAVRIRKDSEWNVPEPELTLFICSKGTIEGYTIGNDMSSRDIEGENPLYLPQAKSYDASAAIGPCLYVSDSSINPDSKIQIDITRDKEIIFSGEISINRMKRKHEELAQYLFRETSFPHGVYLMTGTGIVPPDNFTLNAGDEIRISIDGIGTLTNTVTQG
jgi:2-dehydro-3-deoxy-D-arabinonate dehydratase